MPHVFGTCFVARWFSDLFLGNAGPQLKNHSSSRDPKPKQDTPPFSALQPLRHRCVPGEQRLVLLDPLRVYWT